MKLEDCFGKICPYCKTTLLSSDNLVACSACEMPHHKDCWVENQGCTTFGCMGTITRLSEDELDFEITIENEPAVSVPPICSSCGNVLQEGMRFCNRCGTPYTPTASPTVYCGGCGQPFTENASFCRFCGSPRSGIAAPSHPVYAPPAYAPPVYPVYAPPVPLQPTVYCNSCGTICNAGATFCNRCGRQLLR